MTATVTLHTPDLDARLDRIDARLAALERRLAERPDPLPGEDRIAVGLTEAARLLSVDRQTVTRLATVGLIERFHVGRKPLFPVDGLRAYARREAEREAAGRPVQLRRAG